MGQSKYSVFPACLFSICIFVLQDRAAGQQRSLEIFLHDLILSGRFFIVYEAVEWSTIDCLQCFVNADPHSTG